MRDLSIENADVLVLGAGLAGLRAAWAAKQADPSARVAVVGLKSGPSGSSFANANNMLGIQVPATDQAREDFRDAVLRLAAPGFADPALAQALAQDAAARFADLRELGLRFKTGPDGELCAFPGCFGPHAHTSHVFTDLGHAFSRFRNRLESLEVEFWEGLRVLDLVADHSARSRRAHGALLLGPDGPVAAAAGATILALGGPAPLFSWRMSGRGLTGSGYAMLRRAGAELANQGYVQFLWARLPGRTFWPIWDLAAPGAWVLDPQGRQRPLPEDLRALAAERSTHCPAAYGRPDAALDRFVLGLAGADGSTEVFIPGQGRFRVVPLAHAGNGGARVDSLGRSSVEGLYALGECATGMHGANRMGGCMVLATQVFGARAGQDAAQAAAFAAPPDAGLFAELAEDLLLDLAAEIDPDLRPAPPFSRELHAAVALGGAPELPLVRDALAADLEREVRYTGRQALESALDIAGFLLAQDVYAAQAA